MSVENFEKFIEWCETDEEQNRKMEAEGDMSLERLIQLANAAGYECWIDDIWSLASSGKKSELNETDLDKVVGGSSHQWRWRGRKIQRV